MQVLPNYDTETINKVFYRYLETGSEEDLGILVSSCDPIIASIVFHKSPHAEDISQDIRLYLVAYLRKNPILIGWKKDPWYRLFGLITTSNNRFIGKYKMMFENESFERQLDYVKERLKTRSQTYGCDFEKEFETWAVSNGVSWEKLIDWIHIRKLRDKLGRSIIHDAIRLKELCYREQQYFSNVDMYNRIINGITGGSINPEKDKEFRDEVVMFAKTEQKRLEQRFAGIDKERVVIMVRRIMAKIETDFGMCLDCGQWVVECSCEKIDEE